MKGYEIIWKVDNYLRNLQPSLDCRGAIFISTSFSGFYIEDSNHSTAPNGLVYMQAMLPQAQSNDDDDTMISISHQIHVQFGWSTASECSVSTQQNCVCVCACCFNVQLCAFEWWQCVDFQQLRIAWTIIGCERLVKGSIIPPKRVRSGVATNHQEWSKVLGPQSINSFLGRPDFVSSITSLSPSIFGSGSSICQRNSTSRA